MEKSRAISAYFYLELVEYSANKNMANYLKSFLVGVAGALGGVVGLIIVSIRLDSETGGINLDSRSVEAAALVGFIVAATWQYRRLNRGRRA
jgi:hypothetical protein